MLGTVLGSGYRTLNEVDQNPSPPGARSRGIGWWTIAIIMDAEAEPLCRLGDAARLWLVDQLTATPRASLTLSMSLISMLLPSSLDICQEAWLVKPQLTHNYSWGWGRSEAQELRERVNICLGLWKSPGPSCWPVSCGSLKPAARTKGAHEKEHRDHHSEDLYLYPKKWAILIVKMCRPTWYWSWQWAGYMQCRFGMGRTLDWGLKEVFSSPDSSYSNDLVGSHTVRATHCPDD